MINRGDQKIHFQIICTVHQRTEIMNYMVKILQIKKDSFQIRDLKGLMQVLEEALDQFNLKKTLKISSELTNCLLMPRGVQNDLEKRIKVKNLKEEKIMINCHLHVTPPLVL